MQKTEPLHDVFHGISDPSRRKILLILKDGKKSIAQIARHFSINRNAVRKHLSLLEDAGLVASEPRGRETLYSLRAAPLAAVVDWLSYFEFYWDEKLGALKDYAEKVGRVRE